MGSVKLNVPRRNEAMKEKLGAILAGARLDDVTKALTLRASLPERMRYRVKPPDVCDTSLLAGAYWALGLMRQDEPVSFWIKISLLSGLLLSSILSRLF